MLSTGSPPGTNQRTWCPPIVRQVSGGDNVTPTISVSCTPTELELGPYPPPSTTSGSCSTTVNPSGGTYSWSVNKNTISLSAGTNSATYSAANPSQSQGDTIVSVTYTVNGQSATAQSNGITTHNPTSLAVTGDNFYPTGWACSGTNSVECIIGNGTCSPSAGLCSYDGPLRIRSYDVHDQLNQPFTALGLTLVNISESVTVSTTCPDVGQPVLASSPSTPFSDKLAACSRCCLPGGQNCTTTTAPTQAILANGNVVRSEIITWTCTSISLNP